MICPSNVDFQSSYLLAIELSPTFLILHVEAALQSKHKLFGQFSDNQSHCYRKLRWHFEIEKWESTSIEPIVVAGANNEKDLGSIESVITSGRFVEISTESGIFKFIPISFQETVLEN
jgi:hypothetical protein